MSTENKLLACLKAIGVDPKIDSFSDRKKLQKIVHLMEEAGVQLPYRFSWYFRGPYSPALADSLYEIVRSNITEINTLNENESSIIKKIGEFLGDKINSSDYLELLDSILYLKRKSQLVNASKDDILEFIKENKPYFSGAEIKNCWNNVQKFEEIFPNS